MIEHRVEVWRSLVNRVVILSPDGGVLADGEPDEVLTRNGAELAELGVWIPEFPPAAPVRTTAVSTSPLIRTESLSVARVAHHVLGSALELELKAGGLLAITGPNGAGKSTLGLTLGGLLPPAAGRVVAAPELADGAPEWPIAWKSRQRPTRIGTVFQDPEHQFLSSTVRRELEVGPRALRLPEAEVAERVDELLDRLRLGRLAEANPFTLSGGEKRRLSVGTVLATRPRVLILDEPTFGQDSRTWRELVSLLAGLLDEGSAAVAITHDADFVAALATSEIGMAAWSDEPGRVTVVR